jgi:hypothetical protein
MSGVHLPDSDLGWVDKVASWSMSSHGFTLAAQPVPRGPAVLVGELDELAGELLVPGQRARLGAGRERRGPGPPLPRRRSVYRPSAT